MVYHNLVGTPLKLCGGALETGCQHLDMGMEGVIYPFGDL